MNARSLRIIFILAMITALGAIGILSWDYSYRHAGIPEPGQQPCLLCAAYQATDIGGSGFSFDAAPVVVTNDVLADNDLLPVIDGYSTSIIPRSPPLS